jgi:biofilm protein TabA
MILDSLGQARLYHQLHAGLPAAFAWLERNATGADPGKYQVTDEVVAIVDAYRTKPSSEKKWESHRRHVDLQVVLSGTERVGWAPASGLQILTPYNPEKDAEFYESPDVPETGFRLHPGLFAIFFPHDGHQPGVIDGDPTDVRKVVFKLRI